MPYLALMSQKNGVRNMKNTLSLRGLRGGMSVSSVAGRNALIPERSSHDGLHVFPGARKTNLAYERQLLVVASPVFT